MREIEAEMDVNKYLGYMTLYVSFSLQNVWFKPR
jgi:hypothetical protein